jgi:hypothetical protein
VPCLHRECIDDHRLQPLRARHVAQLTRLLSRAEIEWTESEIGALEGERPTATPIERLSYIGARDGERERYVR